LSDPPQKPGETAGAADAREAARAALTAGAAGVPGADRARLEPIPIVGPDAEPAGWFVGLVDGERLIGFIQLDADLVFHRAATFGGPGQAAADWLDPRRVLELAGPAMKPGERPGRPVLSYDAHPDRIGWIVPVTSAEGGTRRLMVAGTSVFEMRPATGIG
jgi:hypothetical protein